MLEAGARLGRYRIEGLLGQGGMGEVYRATDTELLRQVALKVLPTGKDDAMALDRLRREARAAARLEHPNAVTVFDVGTSAEGMYIAMELVDGATLRHVLTTDPPMPDRIRWLRQVAEVLDAAHDASIVHRDVKPENVMIRKDGNAKVLDFGIARTAVFERGDLDTVRDDPLGTLTTNGAVVGTTAYMAPEQLRGEALDGRVDQFGWGVMAFEVLTGELPWGKQPNGVKLVSTIVSTDAPAPRTRGAPISAELDQIVHRSLSRDRDRRFPTMRALIGALAYAERQASSPHLGDTTGASTPVTGDGAPVVLPAPSKAPVAAAPAPRWPNAVKIVALVALVTTVAAIGAGLWRWRRKLRAARADEASLDARSHCAKADADAAFAEGLLTWRTASEHAGGVAMDRAASLDAACAGPRLRLAFIRYPSDPPRGRVLFAAARAARASLSTRDAALLDAAASYFDDPPDHLAWSKAMDAVAASHPEDADVAYFHAYALWRAGLGARARGESERAVELAPDFARGRWLTAMIKLERFGDAKGALTELDTCVARLPAASSCHGQRAILLAETGRCDELEAAARSWLARAPDAPGPRTLLASVLVQNDAPRMAAEEAWLAGVDRMPEPQRDEARARGLARLALHHGDVRATEAAYRRWVETARTREDVDGRLGPTAELASIYVDLGKRDEAARLAKDHLGREAALQRDDAVWWTTTQETPIAPAVLLAWASGDAATFAVHRRAWLERATAWEKAGRVPGGFAWITGWARFVRSEADAREAFAAEESLPRREGRFLPPQLAAWAGEALELGGRDAEALKLLRPATAACNGWEWPAGEYDRALVHRARAAYKTREFSEAKTLTDALLQRLPPESSLTKSARAFVP